MFTLFQMRKKCLNSLVMQSCMVSQFMDYLPIFKTLKKTMKK